MPSIATRANVETRFWSKVDRTPECWNWTASIRKGYGQFWLNGAPIAAHRVAWELTHGPIIDDMVLDHRCFNKRCVRPSHLRQVTLKQNLEHREGPNGQTVTGHRNVYWMKTTRKFSVTLGHNGRTLYFGSYDSIDEAVSVAERARQRTFSNL